MSNHNISRLNYQTKTKAKVKYDFYAVLVFSYLNKFDPSDQALLMSRYLDSMLNQGRFNFNFLVVYVRFWLSYRKETDHIKFFRKVFRKYKGEIRSRTNTRALI